MDLESGFLQTERRYNQIWLCERENPKKNLVKMPEGDYVEHGEFPGRLIFIGHRNLISDINNQTVFKIHLGPAKPFGKSPKAYKLKITSIESDRLTDVEIEEILIQDQSTQKERLKNDFVKFKSEYNNL